MTRSLSTELAEAVGAVPGVDAVYPARPAVEHVIRTRLPGASDAGPELVLVERGADGTSISVHIAVTEREPARDVSRRVTEAVHVRLRELGEPPPARVRVKVGRVG